jgi:CIC family chloride channel protein
MSGLASVIPHKIRLLFEHIRRFENLTEVILSVLVGVGSGFGAVLFWNLIKLFSWLFFKEGAVILNPLGKYYVIVLPAIGALLFVPLIRLLIVPEARKSEGSAQAIEAIATRGGRIRHWASSVKVLASSICIGSGGSAGPEDPIVQIGTVWGSLVGKWTHLPEGWRRTLILCGAAGGISATFNTPIAGAFFALEVIQRRILAPNIGFVVISSVVANIIARIFLFTAERPIAFTVPEYSISSYYEIIFYVLLGVLCAFAAIGFLRFFFKWEDVFERWKFPAYLKPVAGGVAIGLIGFFYPDIFGIGYGPHYGVDGTFMKIGGVDNALTGGLGLGMLLILFLLKIMATSTTLGSGGSGGIFAPSLFIGAMLGGTFGEILHFLFPWISSGSYAVAGMGAFFAVVVRGPITAVMLPFEMTGEYQILLPLLCAIVVGSSVARRFEQNSIYTLRLKRQGIEVRPLEERDVMRTITVEEAMTKGFPTVSPEMPIRELFLKLEESGHHGFPIVDDKGQFQGVVTFDDVHSATSRGSIEGLTVSDIATKHPLVVYPDQSIHDALRQMGGKEVGRIPVVARDNPSKLLGVLRRHDIIRAYRKGLKREESTSVS